MGSGGEKLGGENYVLWDIFISKIAFQTVVSEVVFKVMRNCVEKMMKE